jgi:hypothetical protein
MSAALQFEIDFETLAPDGSVQTVIALLDQEKAWLKADELLVKLGSKPTDSNKRKIRNIANWRAKGKIISGQKGYKHIRHATPEEIRTHAANWLRHQAKEMDQRATQILKQYHQLPHTPK